MQRMLECPICVNSYDTKARVPKTMPCGHVLCAPCISKLLVGRMLNCPTCRTESLLPNKNVSQLPTSYATLDILDAACEQCRDQSHKKKCEHCMKKLCDTCLQGHPEAAEPQHETKLENLGKLILKLQEDISDDSVLTKIREQQESVINDIMRVYKERVSLLEKQQAELINQVREREKEEIDKQILWRQEAGTVLSEADALYVKYTSSLSAEEIRDKSSRIHHDCIRYTSAIARCQESKPEFSRTTFQASSKEFETLLSHVLKSQRLVTVSVSRPSSEVIPNIRTPDYTTAVFKLSKGIEGRQPGEFDSPSGICTSPRANYIFVSDRLNHRVQVLSSTLQVKYTFGSAGKGEKNFSCPNGIAVSKGGNIFVADEYNHRMQVADESGRFVYRFGEHGSGPEEFSYPKGIAFGVDGLLYVADSGNKRIKVVDCHGRHVRSFGCDGNATFSATPWFVAVSPAGKVAVTDSDGNIHLFRDSGLYLHTLHANSFAHSIEAIAVTFDEHHNMLVTGKTGHIVVLKEDGEFVCRIGAPGDGPGLLKKPRGIAVTEEGNVIVCDAGNHRVQLIVVRYKK